VNVEDSRALIFLAIGAVVSIAYLLALKWNVSLYCASSQPLVACSFHVLRLLGVSAIFVLIARIGAAPLLFALAGFQLIRIFVMRERKLLFEGAS
jgi:F1F0 ATPase subunit 2